MRVAVGQRPTARLRTIWDHALRHTALWGGRGARAVDAGWDALPTSGRGDVVERFPATVADGVLDEAGAARWYNGSPDGSCPDGGQLFRSAGAAGRMGWFLHDRAMWGAHQATVAAVFAQLGCGAGPAEERIAVLGTDDSRHTLVRSVPALGEDRCRVVGLQGGLAAALARLQDQQPSIIWGFSSALVMAAQAQRAGQLAIRPRLVITSTDALDADARAVLVGAWGATVVDTYATTETSILAVGCDAGRHHLHDDLAWAEPGPDGRLMVTNLVNRAQPYVRYLLPEVARWPEGPCPCGGPGRSMVLVGGRTIAPLRVPSPGAVHLVHPIVVRSAIDLLPGIRGVTFHPTDGAVTVRLDATGDGRLVRDAVDAALLRAGLPRPGDLGLVVEQA